eukprot:s6469_g2.t1
MPEEKTCCLQTPTMQYFYVLVMLLLEKLDHAETTCQVHSPVMRLSGDHAEDRPHAVGQDTISPPKEFVPKN